MPPLLTLAEIRAALDAGEVSSAELVRDALAAARATQSSLHCFASLREEPALEEAARADAQRTPATSILAGVPVALKDNILQRGEPGTCASRVLEGFRSPYDATATARLRAAGAIVIGRTNMDEFAMGSSSEHSAYGPVRNPWDKSRIPGGSSGGSAAAVAAGIVPVALGSDTGGSIRQPAACCGVVGLKPTYGRVSRYGLVAFASSLDQIGPIARSADDAARVLEVISGRDACDATSLAEPVPVYADALTGDIAGLVVGLPSEYFVAEGVDAEVLRRVREAVAELERAGARVREISLPHTEYAIATYYLICTAEASSNLARYDGVRYGLRAAADGGVGAMYRETRSQGFGAEVKRRILLGTYVLSAGYYDAYYRRAQKLRTLLRGDFERALEHCDVIATPTMPEPAFAAGERAGDPLRMYLSDVYTVSANLAGIPGISLPCGFANALPVGLQLLGRALDEATLLRVADSFQRRTRWHLERPAEFS